MTVDILNLPNWDVTELVEAHDEYIIKVRYTVQPDICAFCGVKYPRLHRYGTKLQSYRDLPIHGKKVTLRVQRKKWKCLECTHTFFEHLRDLDDTHRATRRLVQWVQVKALERTFTSLADDIGVDEGTIRNIFNRHVTYLEETVIFNTPRWLGLTELPLIGQARGILTNVETNTMIDILPGRKRLEVAKRLEALPDRERIELVAMDMWMPYREAVRTVLPQAIIVIDKFHIVSMANSSVDKVYKQISKGLTGRQRRALSSVYVLLSRRRAELVQNNDILLNTQFETFPELKAAYELKEELCEIWNTAPTGLVAIVRYQIWLKHLQIRDMSWAFSDLVSALSDWADEVFAYFDYPVTNAVTEALNDVLEVVDRLGRGHSLQALRAKVLYSAKNLYPRVTKLQSQETHHEFPIDKFSGCDAVPINSDGIYLIELKRTILDDDSSKEAATQQLEFYGQLGYKVSIDYYDGQ